MNSRIWKIFIALVAVFAAAHCNTTDRTRRGYLESTARAYGAPPRPAIIVPGFGVTRLFDPVTGRYVWGTAHAMVQRRYADDLELPPSATDRLVPRGLVGSRGPVNIGWQLREGLRKYGRYVPGESVFVFEYDWRLSALVNAERLRERVAEVRAATGTKKIDLVTHSAGSLVALTYVKLVESEPVENLVLIAPATNGVADAFRLLARGERLIRRAFTPELAWTWPFAMELLPKDGRFLVDERGNAIEFDAWNADDWERLGAKPNREQLATARRLRNELARTPLPGNIDVHVFAGDCVPTARRVLRRDDGSYAFYPTELRDDERDLAAILFEDGDGTVPVSSTETGVAPQLFCDGHQGLAADPTVHRALIRTLRRER